MQQSKVWADEEDQELEELYERFKIADGKCEYFFFLVFKCLDDFSACRQCFFLPLITTPVCESILPSLLNC